MENQLILEGNFNSKIHTLKNWCDAFGNLVEPPEGYYLLKNNAERHDKIQKGDLHFDIYSGWVDGHSDYHNGGNVLSEGRWRAWARKSNT
jgi:hypothetical protein